MVSITGKVVNYWTAKPIGNVTVNLGGYIVNTDSNGEYTISGVAPANYTVQVTHRDYEPLQFPLNLSVENNYAIDVIKIKPVFKAL